MILIYLTAGRGSRLPIKFRDKPKCLVKINNKTLIERNKIFFKNFKKKIIITGYKSIKIKKIANQFNFEVIVNKSFSRTNMVYSMFLAKKKINQDVVVCYGDIIFDHRAIKLLKNNQNILPVNKNWFKYWKKRMNKKRILEDAENLVVKNNIITHIGGKIKNDLPKYQFMGIFKLKRKTFQKLSIFFKKLNIRTDMTNFLNTAIKSKKVKFIAKKYSSFWHEIDTNNDILVAKKSKDIL